MVYHEPFDSLRSLKDIGSSRMVELRVNLSFLRDAGGAFNAVGIGGPGGTRTRGL